MRTESCGCTMPNGMCLCAIDCDHRLCHPDKTAFIAPEVKTTEKLTDGPSVEALDRAFREVEEGGETVPWE